MIKIERILVPTDFSDCSREALRYGLELAKLFKAEVFLLHVMAPPVYPAQLVLKERAMEELEARIRASSEQELADLESGMNTEAVACETRVEQGAPHEEITRVAEECGADLIVIGTHGYTGTKHFLLGSTAEKVVRRSPCPVLTVKGG